MVVKVGCGAAIWRPHYEDRKSQLPTLWEEDIDMNSAQIYIYIYIGRDRQKETKQER